MEDSAEQKLPGPTITRITVAGFKSISEEQSIEIRPLTLLAGANSSGKSSIMQPLLLMKQTLELPYDPGALLLSGPNVKFTSAEQLLSRRRKEDRARSFGVGIHSEYQGMPHSVSMIYRGESNTSLGIEEEAVAVHGVQRLARLRSNMSKKEIWESAIGYLLNSPLSSSWIPPSTDLRSARQRCFLHIEEAENRSLERMQKDFDELQKALLAGEGGQAAAKLEVNPEHVLASFSYVYEISNLAIALLLLRVLHLPGFRGNPERSNPVTAVGDMFPGTFDKYYASVILNWQTRNQVDKIEQLTEDLRSLGLARKVTARARDATQVEVFVERLLGAPSDSPDDDPISVADVGFGVSQALPVIVALHTAQPGQLVYLEQPEIHLHPRAQLALAKVLARAANRGVRIIAETHSDSLILGVQTLVADGTLAPDKVKLHWFSRGETDGITRISSADLDDTGSFGDWPQDFADVAMDAQSRYLDSAGARRRPG